MAEPSATYTQIDAALFTAGLPLRETNLLVHLLQNVVWLYKSHAHQGAPGDGAFLPTADPKAIAAYSTFLSGPFA